MICHILCYRQFTYVNYNPKGYKYGSQVGVIIKRLYPGEIKICDDEGRVVETRAALSWHDYFYKKDELGLTYARRVKQEFWVIELAACTLSLLFDRKLLTLPFLYLCL